MEGNKLKTQIPKKPTGVFYLDGNKAFYFEQSMGTPIPLDIPVDVVSNLELINKKKLDGLIQTFIRSYKLIPSNIVLLLSVQFTFDKDFPRGSIEVQKNMDEFLELVPFDEILDKKVLMSDKTHVVATNRELCEAVKSSFLTAGFIVSGAYPLSLCIETIPALQSNLDLNLVVSKIPELKGFNLLPIIEISENSPEKEKPDKNRLFLLGGVFAFLIVILLIVLYKNVFAPQKPAANTLPTPKTAPVAPAVSAPTSVPIEQPTTNPSTSSGVNIVTPIPTTGQF